MVISCFSYRSFGFGKKPVSLTQIPFTVQSNKPSWAMEQCLHYAYTQAHALCSGFIHATGLRYWNHISHFGAWEGSLLKGKKNMSSGWECNPVMLWCHKFHGCLCLGKPTSKSTSGRQLHPQKGPWIFSTGSLCSLATINLGEKGCHCCIK